jgi:hypothetical protein
MRFKPLPRCEIWGFHGGENDDVLLNRLHVESSVDANVSKNILSLSSGLKMAPKPRTTTSSTSSKMLFLFIRFLLNLIARQSERHNFPPAQGFYDYQYDLNIFAILQYLLVLITKWSEENTTLWTLQVLPKVDQKGLKHNGKFREELTMHTSIKCFALNGAAWNNNKLIIIQLTGSFLCIIFINTDSDYVKVSSIGLSIIWKVRTIAIFYS